MEKWYESMNLFSCKIDLKAKKFDNTWKTYNMKHL